MEKDLSKGSNRRPEDYNRLSQEWDRIFGAKMKVIIYGKDNCPYCDAAQRLCEQKDLPFEYKKLGRDFDALEMAEEFPSARTFPQIIYKGEKIGGYTDFQEELKNGS